MQTSIRWSTPSSLYVFILEGDKCRYVADHRPEISFLPLNQVSNLLCSSVATSLLALHCLYLTIRPPPLISQPKCRWTRESVKVLKARREKDIRCAAKSFWLHSVEDSDEIFLAVGTEVNEGKVQTHKCPQLVIGGLNSITTATTACYLSTINATMF